MVANDLRWVSTKQWLRDIEPDRWADEIESYFKRHPFRRDDKAVVAEAESYRQIAAQSLQSSNTNSNNTQ